MTISTNDRAILRDLAAQYMELCQSERTRSLIADWRRLNNMQPCRPMIHANCGLLGEEIQSQMPEPRVADQRLKNIERQLNRALLWDATLGDDRVFHPWFTVRAEMLTLPEGDWGVAPNKIRDEVSHGWRHMPVFKTVEDLERLKATEHRVLDPFPPIARKLEETLDTKLDVLKRIPNLTKILSGPLADPACYPETFGDRCVISWRPVSSIIASERFDEGAQRRQLQEGLQKLKGCTIEVHMHEPMTVQGDLERVRTWVRIAREESDRN